ncbi:hypothetical protein CKCE_0414 [Candidatus Kinetoplastibacterium crithidii (ex Angomonas deanei ATCC 30255)]|nr:hypothetical protein CKCE_0414 [Candidatus Kinetoplastibacterium crithidii (ex Angomonas deanei ATCC 30255)]
MSWFPIEKLLFTDSINNKNLSWKVEPFVSKLENISLDSVYLSSKKNNKPFLKSLFSLSRILFLCQLLILFFIENKKDKILNMAYNDRRNISNTKPAVIKDILKCQESIITVTSEESYFLKKIAVTIIKTTIQNNRK